jgi:hypothetical protein
MHCLEPRRAEKNDDLGGEVGETRGPCHQESGGDGQAQAEQHRHQPQHRTEPRQRHSLLVTPLLAMHAPGVTAAGHVSQYVTCLLLTPIHDGLLSCAGQFWN